MCKLNRIFISAIILLFSFGKLYAQVDLSTGTFGQSFPLFNYSDPKTGLSTSVGLNYNSGNGLLANSVSSSVGTGWSLSAAGVIMRSQVGLPDDQIERVATAGNVRDIKKYPNGYLFNPNIGRGCPVGVGRHPMFPDNDPNQGVYKEHNMVRNDTEQDKFIFSFGGRFGIFVIGRDWNPVVLGDSKIRIEVLGRTQLSSIHARTAISSFVITTEDGLKYYFDKLGLSHTCRYIPHQPNLSNISDFFQLINAIQSANENKKFYGEPLPLEEDPFVINEWYLSRIENSNISTASNDVITFTYDQYVVDYQSGKQFSETRKFSGNGSFNFAFNSMQNEVMKGNIPAHNIFISRTDFASTAITYVRSINYNQRLRSVNLPDGSKYEFNYDFQSRADLNGDNALKSIAFLVDNKKVMSYKLVQGYMYRKTMLPYDLPQSFMTNEKSYWLRLALLEIQKEGDNSDQRAFEPAYKFEYHLGNVVSNISYIIPPRNTVNIDHWGYFNGDQVSFSVAEGSNPDALDRYSIENVLRPQNRKVNNNWASIGLLKKINFPAGGSLEVNYFQNKAAKYENKSIATTDFFVGGVSVIKTKLTDENGVVVSDKSYSYNKRSDGRSSWWGYEQPDEGYYNFNTVRNAISSSLSLTRPGVELAELASPSIYTFELLVNVVVGVATQMVITSIITAIGGTFASIVNPLLTIFGIYQLISVIIDLYSVNYYYSASLSNYNMKMQNRLVFRPSEVAVAELAGGFRGFTNHKFTDLSLQSLVAQYTRNVRGQWISNLWPYVPEQRALNFAYGLPSSVEVYNNSYELESAQENNYYVNKEKVANAQNQNCQCFSEVMNLEEYTAWQNVNNQFFQTAYTKWYSNWTGRVVLNGSLKKVYKNNQLVGFDAVSQGNDPSTLLNNLSMRLSGYGVADADLTFYPTNYTIPGALQRLKSRNSIYIPVTHEKWRMLFNPTNPIGIQWQFFLIDASYTEFQEITVAGVVQVKPYREWVLNVKEPVPSASMGNRNPNVYTNRPDLFRKVKEYIYDANGILVETIMNDQIESTIYDYKNRLSIASVSNAAPSDIAYTSFEADGNGSWLFDPSGIKTTGVLSGFTGDRYYELEGPPSSLPNISITRNNLDPAKTYKLSFWSKQNGSASFEVIGFSSTVLTTINGWSLQSYTITGVSTITLRGISKDNTFIDELRLIPVNASMSTVTYKYGIGKSSECDANNRSTHYEYDALGRAKTIRDENRNIVKTFEYNYKN
jgi:YD repeat-containing protein